MGSLEQRNQGGVDLKGSAENHAQMEAAALMLKYGSFEEIPQNVLNEWIEKHGEKFNTYVRADQRLDRRIVEEEKTAGHLSSATLDEIVSRLTH